jgi:periplasmic copper chaperone A
MEAELKAGAMVAAALLVAGCAAPEPTAPSVDGAWMRLPAVKGRPGAAYFTVHGGPAATTLISVSTDVAIQTELHESMANGMRPTGDVPIPARADVRFAPGGRHAMLFDVNPGVKPGRIVTFRFAFADGTRVLRNARAVAAADPPPR